MGVQCSNSLRSEGCKLQKVGSDLVQASRNELNHYQVHIMRRTIKIVTVKYQHEGTKIQELTALLGHCQIIILFQSISRFVGTTLGHYHILTLLCLMPTFRLSSEICHQQQGYKRLCIGVSSIFTRKPRKNRVCKQSSLSINVRQ